MADLHTIMDALLAACVQRDFAQASELIDESIEWMIYAPVTVFPYAGPRRGREAAVQALSEIMDTYVVEQFEREIVVTQEDQVAAVAAVRVRQRQTQRCLRYRCADFMRFKDGKLIAYRHFINSYDVVEQALGRDLTA